MYTPKTDLYHETSTLMYWALNHAPDWADQPILNWRHHFNEEPEHNYQLFIYKTVHVQSDIDLALVVGQWEHYAGQTWREAMKNPQYKASKMHGYAQRADTEGDYYFNKEHKSGMSFCTTDGRHWYSRDGNHRTVVGKFLHARRTEQTGEHTLLCNVATSRYTVDWKTLGIYEALQECIENHNLRLSVSITRIPLYADEQGGRMVEYYEPLFFVSDNRFGNDALHSHLNCQEFSEYAGWMLETEGFITRQDRLRLTWQIFFGRQQQRLVFPGAKQTFSKHHHHTRWLQQCRMRQRHLLSSGYN